MTGKLDLAHVKVPFGLTLVRCSIPEKMNLDSAELESLDLNASFTGEIYAPRLVVIGDADLGWDGQDYGNKFQASGEVDLDSAQIGGGTGLTLGFAKFHKSAKPLVGGYTGPPPAVYLSDISVKGGVVLGFSSEFDGPVVLDRAKISRDLMCSAGHFSNPGGVALSALSAKIDGDAYLTNVKGYGSFVADGLVQFPAARVNGIFWVSQAKFLGNAGTPHGLELNGATVGHLGWLNVELQNGATLSLVGTKAGVLTDDEHSWPQPGSLILDGFVYDGLAQPNDASSRLRWLRLEPPGIHLQPYRQLAKYLHDQGDELGAMRVLIARDDARFANSGLAGIVSGTFLKWTIGYGHRPMLAILWSLGVVLLGSCIVSIGARAGVMAPTWPENKPPEVRKPYEELQPLLYSFDVFLPFVNLHQEHYWWPDATASGKYTVLGRGITVRGRVLRYYLWLQIIAGWLLSAIFIAGVTGLLRND